MLVPLRKRMEDLKNSSGRFGVRNKDLRDISPMLYQLKYHGDKRVVGIKKFLKKPERWLDSWPSDFKLLHSLEGVVDRPVQPVGQQCGKIRGHTMVCHVSLSV
ncbi:hypothetical protein RRG08_057162 [Elysia crispata]|uniref:Uncharacterized protein n=1 Tax=Elysia crispata TaxID=231223 RepID=A0AAE1E0D8_9GAST|nr:hypothetical protein RRG08_057162 [Elysia crispata]